ncbi:hypothetical protein [Noviherbaspirillum suwonense]|jgi:hypothetical protein|uniref:DUF4175 domain-containing protein n=1 Tax=Noviherbaspirillum suwonense TaxID=1224511 RepID=A0ABY1QIM0_9BURK|nr:hypothetical protein [Noviherbaspirillum suwonense]SMP71907.1 hypothetical protein SAMN06295970_11787 [Noviherbaspirillum suwonense]
MKSLPPYAFGLLALVLGWLLLGAGVFLLAGLGWALLCASVPFIGFALVIFRGLTRAE